MSIWGLDLDEFNLCILHKAQQLMFSVNDHPYYASMKMIYQTYYNKDIKVFTGEKEWVTAKIVGRPCNENLIRINKSLICSGNTLIACEDGYKPAKLLSSLDKIRMPITPHWSGPTFLSKDRLDDVTDISGVEPLEDDWLFGLRFFGPNNSYTLKNGMIVSARQ